MQNLLITGGAGFIGSNFVRYLLETDPQVRVVTLDALTYAGSRVNLDGLCDPSRHTFVQGDICDTPLVLDLLRNHRLDAIVHFAAETHVDRSILAPAPFIQTNVHGTLSLLEAARQVWLQDPPADGSGLRFLHISTDEVYGSLEPDQPAWAEESPYAPCSPYAASKAASDHLVRSYGYTFGLPYSITNCTNNYGPCQFPEKLIPLTILHALEGAPIPIYGDGRQVRDWLHVRDHCEAIARVLNAGVSGETYHVGSGGQADTREVVEAVCDILDELRPGRRGSRQLITQVRDRPGHARRYALDCRKIERELGWRPQHDLQAGLLETVRWYLDHPQWLSAIRRRPEYRAWLKQNYAERGDRP